MHYSLRHLVSLLMYFLLSELLFSASVISHCSLLTHWHQGKIIIRSCFGYVILLYVFLLVALYFCCLCEMAFIALGVSILPLSTLLIYVLELFRQYGICFHCFTMAIQKNNWKKPDYKEKKTWTSTSDQFRES